MRLPWPLSRWFGRARPEGPATRRAGVWGEEVAARHLRAKGYRLLGRNVRFGSRHELDIVARAPDNQTLVFIEVKTRRSEAYGRPADAVDLDKRRALGGAARQYLRRMRAKPAYIRFDVVEVVGVPGDPAPVVRLMENAFSPGADYRVPW